MKFSTIDLKKLANELEEQCPFICFAMLTNPDPGDRVLGINNLELSAFVDSEMGTWTALENILPVIDRLVPEMFCEVTLLNRVDPATRFKAVNGNSLFIRQGKEILYREFVERAKLDYKIQQALMRKKGLTG